MDIGLIGAGPRGLLTLERLVSWHQAEPLAPMTVTLLDPYPIGGRVWRSDQPASLIMNTAAQMITLFYDQSVASLGPYQPGPNLAQWAQTKAPAFISSLTDLPAKDHFVDEAHQIGPNSYPTRVFFGLYQRWVFGELQQRADETMTIRFEQTTVTAVRPRNGEFTVTTKTGETTFDAVVMALGNNENFLTREQTQLAAFARAHDEFYLPPNFPGEGDLSNIQATDVVILRGLGLSFFDFVSRLTEGRGGKFSARADGQLTYHKSGTEPLIVAGSRRGFPYHAKGRNEKAPGEEVQPHFLTQPQIDAWAGQGHVAANTFWQALQHEVEFTYYSKLLARRHPTVDVATFQAAFLQAPADAVAALPLQAEEQLNWETLIHPAGEVSSDMTTMAAYLRADAAAATAGSKTGPLTSALEVLRDLRDPIRQIVEKGLLTDDEYLDFFLRQFNGINDFLSIGPPARRIAELAALLDAGVVKILPPNMTVVGEHGYFMASSGSKPTVVYKGTALIEARVPAVNAPTAQNPLIRQLLHDDLASLFELQLDTEKRFQSGAILVDRQTLQLLNSDHQPQGQLYFWGVPTEGFNWLTTASPRPYVNDVSLRQANIIAKQIIHGVDR